jgi:hypothetical protein
MERIKLDKTVTSRRQIRDCINASTIVFKPKDKTIVKTKTQWFNIPGTTATVFNALNTRNVRRTDTFPKLTKKVIYLIK